MADEKNEVDSPYIPDELMIEILARLPVKALIKFTCVCKLWLSLIKSSSFVAKQYATRTMPLSQKNSHGCHFFMTFSSLCYPMGTIDLISYETLEVSTTFECKPVDSSHRPPESNYVYGWSFFGACNGIIGFVMCKYYINVALLWNPSTRQLFKTAKSKCEFKYYMGLGFDPDAKDYKIVTFGCSEFCAPYGILIYSLASDSWRNIEDSSTVTFGRWKSLMKMELPSSNGKMCSWFGVDKLSKIGSTNIYFMLSFDMVDEVFVETPLPDGALESIHQCTFVQQRSHLSHPAIVCYGLDNGTTKVTYVNVWVLQEYGEAGYWTKQVSVMLPEDIIVAQPTGLWKDDEILFVGDLDVGVYVRYNFKTQELKTLDHIHVDHYPSLIGYTESLVSIQTKYEERIEESSDNNDRDYSIGLDYCLCEVNQPLASNSCIF